MQISHEYRYTERASAYNSITLKHPTMSNHSIVRLPETIEAIQQSTITSPYHLFQVFLSKETHYLEMLF